MPELLPDGWDERSLSDLGQYVNGYAFKPVDWSEHGLPIVRIAQITGSTDGCDYYSGELSDVFKLKSGDLVFSWSGTLAVVRWSGGPAWLNQHLFRVNPAPDVDRDYLFHLLSASVAEMDKRTHGSTMKHIKRGELHEYEISFPRERREQAKIAQILDTLDTQISQTKALIAKLERIKQGLLTDLLTRGIDDNGQLRPTPDQAPHLYKDSPLGRIPREWRVADLGSYLSGSPKNGYSPQEAHSFTGTYMLGLGCLTPKGFRPIQLKAAPAYDNQVGRALLRDGDLLITRANTRDLVGLVGIYREIGYPCSYPDLMMKLSPASTTSVEFLEITLRSNLVRKQIQATASGTSGSMVKISGTVVQQLDIAMPPRDEQSRILNGASYASKRLENEEATLKSLQSAKQGLMDDLLTGRVRVTPLLDTAQQAAQ